jgi:hypothetical protein
MFDSFASTTGLPPPPARAAAPLFYATTIRMEQAMRHQTMLMVAGVFDLRKRFRLGTPQAARPAQPDPRAGGHWRDCSRAIVVRALPRKNVHGV